MGLYSFFDGDSVAISVTWVTIAAVIFILIISDGVQRQTETTVPIVESNLPTPYCACFDGEQTGQAFLISRDGTPSPVIDWNDEYACNMPKSCNCTKPDKGSTP